MSRCPDNILGKILWLVCVILITYVRPADLIADSCEGCQESFVFVNLVVEIDSQKTFCQSKAQVDGTVVSSQWDEGSKVGNLSSLSEFSLSRYTVSVRCAEVDKALGISRSGQA